MINQTTAGMAMKRFTDSIRMSLKTENWYAALVAALTLPDVCGNLESPEKGTKERYVAWFGRWLEPKYTSHVGADKQEHVFLNGEDLYALRCSYLHEGSVSIETQRARKILDEFHFTKPRPRMCIHNNKINNTLQLQVDIFCNDMADAVDGWYESIKEDSIIVQRMEILLIIHDPSDGI